MKITTKLLVGVMAVFCCVIAKAQYLVYSNSFTTTSALPYTSVYNTAPTYVATTNLIGANPGALWICTFTNLNPAINNPGASVPPYGAGTVYLNGAVGTNQGVALLPLAVQTNQVYILECSITVPSSVGPELEMGFSTGDASSVNMDETGEGRFNDSPVEGYAWDYFKPGINTGIFKGGGTSVAENDIADLTPTAGTYVLKTILSTLNSTNTYAFTNMIGHGATNYWFAYGFISSVNGTNPTNQIGTNMFYAASASGAPPLQLNYCGIGAGSGDPGGTTPNINYNWFTVSTPLLPIIVDQPVSGTADQTLNFTNTVLALADTNGLMVAYQWYTNGVALVNGGNISGATNASLIITGVQPYDAGTNYYVVITNTFGAVTSSAASLTVLGPPTFTSLNPITFSTPMVLFGGTNIGATAYLGSTPRFSVFAAGAPPITYFWQTNGVAVGGAISATFSFTNTQWNGPTNFSVIASNFLGTVTNSWPVAYLTTPTNPFPQAVLADAPLAYWRLDDTNVDGSDNGNGDDGYICHDFQSGNNGIYTNVTLGNPGYSPITDPSESSAGFGYENNGVSDNANSMGTNLDFSSASNGEFTVAIWANGEGLGETANAGMITKGYFTGEEYDLDFAPGTLAARFETHNAAGTAANANSSLALTDSNWHFIVGVCDETNGNIFIYVDGALAGYASIPPGSGIVNILNSATTPVMIGDRLQSATDSGAGQQFYGYLDDAQVYGYAMNASQVASLYQAGLGTTPPPYIQLIAPLPPTNVVYLTNATITIPAVAFGTPPIGYYWTNLTAATVLTSGSTNVYADLKASLTIQDVNGSLNGDVLELIVTNAAGSTNWLVNDLSVLTNPPPPLALGYTNAIIYSNSFSADQLTIGGQPVSAFDDLFGTNGWICTFTNGLLNCATVYANGTLATNAGNALLAFTPEPGYIYTMTGTLIIPSAQGDWVSMGFAQSAAQSSAPGTGRYTDTPINGEPWMYIQIPNVYLEPGPRTTVPALELSGLSSSYPLTNTLQLVLNTVTNNAWVASAYIYTNSNATAIGIGTYYYNSSLPIAYAGIGQNAFPGSEQWISWSLTQVAPGGVPPYLLVTPPTNSILLTNATETLPATAFGSTPVGFSWILNNSTVLASGTTNNANGMSPLNANLSIPSTSLSAGQLELLVTNAYGTNITLITLVSPVNTNPTNIVATVTGTSLLLTWPVDHTGWQLQAQTNSLSKGISTNWVNYNPSTGTNQVVIPINLTNGTVFFRLVYP